MLRPLTLALTLTLGGLAAPGCASAPTATRTVLVGPRFYTGYPPRPEVGAVEVDARGRVVALHDRAPADARQVRLPGTFALPGLHDAHIHLLGLGHRSERLDLRDTQTPAELASRVAEYAAAHPDVAWIDGRGWDHSRFPDRAFPTAADIDAASPLPALLVRVGGHAALANSALLALAGVDASTPDPEGGRILRTGDTRTPSGVLLDNAIDLVRAALPAPTDGDRRRWALRGAEACAAAGLTAVHDMGMPLRALEALIAVDAERPLPLRVFVYLADEEPSYAWLALHPPPAALSPRVVVQGIKLVADGALGSRGAALHQEYTDEAGHLGHLIMSPDQLAQRAVRAASLGGQVAIHAIGDRGVSVALDALDAARAANPQSGLRHRVEHAQVVAPADFPRFAALDVIASMQPTHATSDMRWAEARVGPERIRGAYAWRDMLTRRIPLAFGSDAPVESERPLLGLHAAVTRTDPEGRPAGGWFPSQAMTIPEAITGFTLTAAFAIHRESDLGAIAPGKRLDLTLLDRDPRRTPGAWLAVAPVGTVIEGRLQHR